MKLLILCTALALSGPAALAANSAYASKRNIYDEMSQLRGQDALALMGQLDKRAAHSKRWAALVQKALRAFDEQHACHKAASLSQSAWTHMNSSAARSSPQDVSAVSTFAFMAGQWASSCYDEIEKLDTSAITKK